MIIQIDPSGGLAIYDQVVRQVKFAIADGAVASGELVPSVREMAQQLAINPNTVSRAYRQLQDEQVLAPLRGTGLQVALGAQEECLKQRRQLIRQRLQTTLHEAVQSGLGADELQQMISQELNRLKPSGEGAQT